MGSRYRSSPRSLDTTCGRLPGANVGSRAESSAASWSLGAGPFAQLHGRLRTTSRAPPPLGSTVEVRDDINSVMVSNGDVLVPRRLCVAEARVGALLHHEVGTHVVTGANGQAAVQRTLGPASGAQAVTQAQATLTGSDLQLTVQLTPDNGCSGQNVTSQSLVGDQPQKSTIVLVYCAA